MKLRKKIAAGLCCVLPVVMLSGCGSFSQSYHNHQVHEARVERIHHIHHVHHEHWLKRHRKEIRHKRAVDHARYEHKKWDFHKNFYSRTFTLNYSESPHSNEYENHVLNSHVNHYVDSIRDLNNYKLSHDEGRLSDGDGSAHYITIYLIRKK